jgi:mRNA-degrading endonuclease toxin of MazEF toxin-antitoxin module
MSSRNWRGMTDAAARSVLIWLVFFDSAIGREAQKEPPCPLLSNDTVDAVLVNRPVPMPYQMSGLYAAEAFVGLSG